MRYEKIDAVMHKVELLDLPTFEDAERACGLVPGHVDHGPLWRAGMRQLAIVVDEFGLFAPPINQHFFAIGRQLYAGNALIYAYGEYGETVDLDPAAEVIPRFFASAYDADTAIRLGELERPRCADGRGGTWEWPQQPPPDKGKI